MKYLVVYKGDFEARVAGVAVRYLAVGRELARAGHEVVIAGRQVPEDDMDGVRFVSIGAVWREMRDADRIVLHGGGPLLLAMASLRSWFGARVVLDAFAPHWLELYASRRVGSLPLSTRMVLGAKIFFNYFRLIWARLLFDVIAVGTQRQQDLVRGIVSQVGALDLDKGIEVITGGCETPLQPVPARNGGPLRVGWIGGLWDWFDIGPVLAGLAEARAAGQAVQLHLYGVDAARAEAIARQGAETGLPPRAVVFEEWVPYERRFAAWEKLDVAIVWSAASLENDYASRTRNFDCITLGLPVIQNADSFWSEIVDKQQCGLVVEAEGIGAALRRYAENRDLLRTHAERIRALDARFNWSAIARRYEEVLALPAPRQNRALNALVLPLTLVSSLISFLLRFRLRR